MRADDADPAAEETVQKRAGLGGDPAGVGAPQPHGVSLPVPERALELQYGRAGKSSEKR